MEGTVVLQYKYPHHRRTYIVKNADEYKTISPVYLPNVRERVGMISFLYGRRIDLLRQAIYKAERIAGKEIYLYPVIFWRIVIILILIAMIIPHVPPVLRELMHIVNSIKYYILHWLDILQM